MTRFDVAMSSAAEALLVFVIALTGQACLQADGCGLLLTILGGEVAAYVLVRTAGYEASESQHLAEGHPRDGTASIQAVGMAEDEGCRRCEEEEMTSPGHLG